MAELKHSRQRDAIVRNLRNRCDHPTADMIYSDIRREFPNISLGTVYRNLSLLADMGEIKRLPATKGADRFDGNMKPHDHFICRICGSVQDMDFVDTRKLEAEAQKAQGFEGVIEDSTVNFYGICGDCLARESRVG